MHNFFIPPPSPMYEQPEVQEPSGHRALLKGSTATSWTARSTARDAVAQDQSESGPNVPTHVLKAKPHTILHDSKQDVQNPSDNFAISQHGVFDIFEDHSVSVSAKKAQASAQASVAIKAKRKAAETLPSTGIKRKTRLLDQVQQEHAAHTPKPSLDLVKEPTRASAAVAGAPSPASAPMPVPAVVAARAVDHPNSSAEGLSVTESHAAASQVAPHANPAPKPGRAAIDYGGVFGDPFEDNAVDAAAAHQAQPSWF
jgi:hypothetical protein